MRRRMAVHTAVGCEHYIGRKATADHDPLGVNENWVGRITPRTWLCSVKPAASAQQRHEQKGSCLFSDPCSFNPYA